MESRKKRIKDESLLKRERSLLIELIEAGDLSYGDRFLEVDQEVKNLELINSCEFDILKFAHEFFGEDLNPGNPDNLIPAGVSAENAADFHKELCDLLNQVARGDKGNHVAWACPRGHAKTAYLSNVFITHRLVYGHGKFTVLVSDTVSVASTFINWSRNQLKFNDKLISVYGRLLNERPSQNILDNKEEFVTNTNLKVQARGLGTQMRGLRHGAYRPDLMVLDDIESNESTNTAAQIEKSSEWFSNQLLPALSRTGTCVYLGTILCYGSLLSQVLKRKDFESRKYKAIQKFSDSPLWEDFKKIYRKDVETSREEALDFFKANEAEMLSGTDVLWEDFFPYISLMEKLENSGIKSFNQEYQNEPTDETRQLFKPELFMFYDQGDLPELEYYFGVDFAMGKEKGDFSAVTVLGKNTKTSICYVVDVYRKRVHPDVFMRDILDLVTKYAPKVLAVESQMAQEFFADTLINFLSEKSGFPAHSRVKKIKQRQRKSLRIEALLPEVSSGKIRFSKTQKELLEELYYFGMVPHDDSSDALSMAFSAVKEGYLEINILNEGRYINDYRV